MLILGRRKGESILIGDDIEITIVDIQGDYIRMGIQAPREVSIVRKEIKEQIREENIKAAEKPEGLPALLEEMKKFI
ncbi:carbon storage regulator CsrA [Syntrophomonas wolfei]|jgi:carbon storage regulator|uniref:Translational regulator CsrA n=1 Tax=Syntrophomonas wolfei subsp. wolfei (strain DSM 2245B / Goettingen) TaxID=335541 RepID=CSRA_SYNWW|nr:carbon storage regulator CsrA [Syntrophomonas wolfei]Q0B0F6.1 RecName: Full=Translational regulator CsrA [Syntrophomonas wolfei subsp. wolfei str. Goettingen G311]ABI67548.1 carbon storage regulator [Syntrophomonas wolfei subsp. wolfei str. Goettingen G311]